MSVVLDQAGPAAGTLVLSRVPALAEAHGDPDAARIADFELTLQTEPRTDLRLFLPPRTAANYTDTLVELVRVDLEWRWDRGAPKPAEDYLKQFPELAGLKTAVAAVAYEEYRARLRIGDVVRPAEYAVRFDIPTEAWPAPSAPPADQMRVEPVGPTPVTRHGVPDPDPAVPEAGSEFHGFWLMDSLGSGPNARVFLARQGDVAGRPVALKVGFGLFAESAPIAHLHHTNIIPIYSLHQAGRLQVVCMPYFGGTTLDRVLVALRVQAQRPRTGAALGQLVRDDRASTKFAPPAPSGTWEAFGPVPYPAVVAGLGAQLAAGLAHAHDRGVRHGKLKPSNVLLGDDGVPMLLDFDLAEHSRAGGPADAKEDIYALAVLLCELLTGQLPTRDGPDGLPAGGARNPAVPRALDRVLRGCLAGKFRSSHAVAAALDGCARRPSWADRLRAWAGRRV